VAATSVPRIRHPGGQALVGVDVEANDTTVEDIARRFGLDVPTATAVTRLAGELLGRCDTQAERDDVHRGFIRGMHAPSTARIRRADVIEAAPAAVFALAIEVADTAWAVGGDPAVALAHVFGISSAAAQHAADHIPRTYLGDDA
jgi:hypothetical protein